MQERRKQQEQPHIPDDQARAASVQLEAEIRIIEGWLQDLDEAREDNPESLAARRTYSDMLQSRREFLKTLKQQ